MEEEEIVEHLKKFPTLQIKVKPYHKSNKFKINMLITSGEQLMEFNSFKYI